MYGGHMPPVKKLAPRKKAAPKKDAGPRRLPVDQVRKMVTDFLNLDNMAQQFGAQADTAKRTLRDDILPSQGQEDDAGHFWITFDEDIEDPSGKSAVRAIKRERRAPKRLNEDRAEAFLRRKGLWDECTEQVTAISEDAILAAAFQKRISEKELNALYDVKESWAFVPQRR